MKIWESIKNIMTIPEDDDYEEEIRDTEPEKKADDYVQPKRQEPSPRIIKSKASNQTQGASHQLQVVLVKPDRFEDVTSIADHLNDKKTVVLNLESANRELSRRIIDFLGGVAYANHGNIKKVANSTYIIVAYDVDLMGEVMFDEFTDSSFTFNV